MHVPHSGVLEAHETPSRCYKDTIVVPLNDVEALESMLKKWKEKKNGVAAIIVDPLGGESGALPFKKDWLQSVRSLCDKYEVLLIFDEVITGFRLKIGGAQEYCI